MSLSAARPGKTVGKSVVPRERMEERQTPLLTVAGLAAVLWAYACGDGGKEPQPPDPPRPTTVAVTPATAELTAVGATVQLNAEVLDQNGQAIAWATVLWASSHAVVATMSEGGAGHRGGQRHGAEHSP